MQRKIRVLIAMDDAAVGLRVAEALGTEHFAPSSADTIQAVERVMSDADVIITDTEFASGAFADWLSLWPIPTVLVVDPGHAPDNLADKTVDESSAFILRDPDDAWIRYAPILARKAAAVRESLDRQNSNIIRAESSYMNLLRCVPDIVYVLDGDGCFVYLNDAVAQLGWKPAELIGRHFAEIVHPEDVPEVSRSIVLLRFEGVRTGHDQAPKLFDERRSGERMTRGLDVRLRHKDGGEWTKANVDSWGEITSLGVNLPEFQGKGTGTIGLIHDVSERRQAERTMIRELDARELLLKEIHHRVKNNLQVVSSLLSLESDCVEDERAKAVFFECQTQVQSMALVHEQIYRGSKLDGVEAMAYFARLADYLAGVHDAKTKGIELSVRADDIVLPIDAAMPLAIITTELVSNSFKHAFPGDRSGRIDIAVERRGDAYAFRVSDDGIGFASSGYAGPVPGKHKGIGMDLIEALAGQLGGRLERSDSGGASTTIAFPAEGKD